jgi:hypothetical protein
MKRLLLFIGLSFATSVHSVQPWTLEPIMPQQQLLAQKDALESLIKHVWEKCLNSLNQKFPDLAQQNPSDEHVLSVNWEFKKQPTVNHDRDISSINSTVSSVIAQASMSSLKFGEVTGWNQPEQEDVLKEVLGRMLAATLAELIVKDVSESLDWCTCTAEYRRITLALLMVNEIREKFQNPTERIVYTSFASGNLLQDYVILSELLLSHNNILVNLIDLNYPDIPALAKKNLKEKVAKNLHKLEMKSRQENAEMIDSFKVKIAQVISTRKFGNNKNPHFDVNVYQNAYEYISRAKTNPQEKSNVLLMVDPSVFSYAIEDYSSMANVINVWIDQEIKPVFNVYLPRHHGVHLYQLKDSVDSKAVQYLQNQLLQLMVSTGASKQYAANFTNALLNKTISFGKQTTDEVLAGTFPRLMQKRAELREEALQEGSIDNDLLQPLTPVKLGDVSVLLSWGTDAHISFQDLVWDTLAPNAIVYQLYAHDPNKNDDANNKIIKVNPEVYKKVDVVIPNAGRASEGQYKRIH